MLSLLDEGLFTLTRRSETRENLSLPQVLHALRRDDVLSFDVLQAHQEQAWYAFLVQLSTMAVVRASGGVVPEGESEWRRALLDLAEGNEAAWHLVTPDLTQPAFMQPPLPEGSLEAAKFKNDIPSPDQLDILVTSKNHDVKRHRVTHPHPEHWIFALIMLQTMEGYLGAGNYGIVRMNGGFGNRPFVGLSPGLSFGARFQRDLNVLIAERERISDLYDPDDGHTLLWTLPWSGAKDDTVKLSGCDPYFIEVCRRIRFTEKDGRLACWRTNTRGQRVDAPSSLNGRTEDPWTPVDRAEEKALTLGGSGFTYQKLHDIFLSGAYAKPMALRTHGEDGEVMYLTARAMVRGQGKTEGLHHRIIPIPEEVSALLSDESAMKALAERAQARVEKAAAVESSVLRPAVAALLSAGRDGQVDWEQVQPWIDPFDSAVDDQFFARLWASAAVENDEVARQDWEAFLKEAAERQFEEAQDGVPLPDTRRWRAISAARSIFSARLRDVLATAFSRTHASEANLEVSADE